MQNDLRIVFMGTPDFAVGILKEMVEIGKNIVGVITAPDKPAGRGRKLMGSAVKDYAVSQNLKVLQPTNLKDEFFLKELEGLNANLQVVVAFRMLPKVVWQMPALGTFNLHASLLPQYRGAAPINWAIINNEEKTGVTTFFIDEKIDTGSIIANKEVAIAQNETAETLHDKLMETGSHLVLETLELIEMGNANPRMQPKSSDLKDAPKLTAENTRIDWTKPGTAIAAFIRGLSPYPVAWSILYNSNEELKIKIYTASFEKMDHKLEPGVIQTSKKELKVACPDGYIIIKDIQLPGKRKMEVSSLLNGYSFDEDSKLS
ncbi:methionyl-tRNA formyltransferase [Aequorivita lipolytica]|uniref:Methionyl-tRNA formyltransferase n=1 Tax=Aequorivita lipolytica TaxID=153267 RepID=A0A5C6YL49_9FLAO|nr:methionyl-tRNA formyltransferase [Aequorivita lipolytica]TXD68248.1 methionyl-tRNA formyltransferase [Aequorivita lipolytica]SRX53474.1 Methionyl-tRNA formyltransferase [Aequorivita lipolytica]